MKRIPKICDGCNLREIAYRRLQCEVCIRKTKNLRRKRLRSSSGLGYVYFAQIKNTDGYIKIGYANDVSSRFPNGCCTDNPYSIQILTTSSGFFYHESELHRLLNAYIIRGEWFYPTPEVVECVTKLSSGVSLDSLLDYLESKVADSLRSIQWWNLSDT